MTSGSVMNEHCLAIERAKPGANRIRPLGAPDNEVADIEAGERRLRKLLLTLANDDPGRAHGRVADQGFRGPAQHRLAAEKAELLGHAAAEALALARGHDEGG